MGRITLKTVNKTLEDEGLEGIIINQGKDYLYFSGPWTNGWKRTAVYTPRLNDLSLSEWINEAKALNQGA